MLDIIILCLKIFLGLYFLLIYVVVYMIFCLFLLQDTILWLEMEEERAPLDPAEEDRPLVDEVKGRQSNLWPFDTSP